MMKYLLDPDWWKQFGVLLGGFLVSIWTFLATLNIHFEWFTDKSINAFIAVISAFGALFMGSLATIANTFLTNRSKKKAAQVVDDYKAQLEAAEQVELEKFKANLEKVQAQSTSTETAPSAEGQATVTETQAN